MLQTMTISTQTKARDVFCRMAMAAAGALLLASSSLAAPAAMVSAQTAAPVWRTDVTGSRTESLPLIGLVPGGQAKSVKLTGLLKNQYFDFGVRADELVSAATLSLHFTASPAVLPSVSQINVFLNGELQRSVPLEKEQIGSVSEIELPLNPKAVRAANQIAIEFVGHYASVCESPANDSLWLDIAPASRLVLVKQSVRLANEIGRFPVPFVDTVSGAPTVLPFVFASAPGSAVKEAAAVAASFVGSLTGWRGADFPVFYNALPGKGHFVVFATNEKRPDFLKDLPPAEGPEARVMDAPQSLSGKMLVISGRTDAELVTAVKGLIRPGNIFIGDLFRVKDYKDPAPRKAYEAPNWIDSDRTIAFSDLMSFPGQLSSRGLAMPPVHLPLRLAPDLYKPGSGDVTMNVRFRFTKPMAEEAAQFRAFVNNFLVDSDNLSDSDGRGSRTVRLPPVNGPLLDVKEGTLALSAVNDLSFAVEYERLTQGGSPENCRSLVMMPHQMEIEPDSTLTIKGFYHYAKLPDLRLFARSGYPFTTYADLSQTVVWMAENAGASEVHAMLNAVARLSAASGAPGTLLRVVSELTGDLRDRDILAVGPVPLLLTDLNRDIAGILQQKVTEEMSRGGISEPEAVFINPTGLAAVVSHESPLKRGRTLVALLAEGEPGAAILGDRLVNPASLADLHGSVAFLTEEGASSFRTGEQFTVGNLPWYQKIWRGMARYPGVVFFCALLCTLLVGLVVFYLMRRWIGGRSR